MMKMNMMKMKWKAFGFSAVIALALTACGGGSSSEPAQQSSSTPVQSNASQTAGNNAAAGGDKQATPPVATERTINYLDKAFKVPAKVDNIVITGAVEAMEDALVLGVEPKGAMSFGGKFPALFAPITAKSTMIGEKTQPNLETIVGLKPQVILASTKFPAETVEKLAKIAPTFQVSHISTNWEANLRLLGELTGKQAEAEAALKKYKDDAAAAKQKLGEKLKDKKVMAVRIRSGNINVYPADVFFNPILYSDFGLTVPETIKAAKAQDVISIEKFAQENPDYVFIQFEETSNPDHPNAIKDLENNPIIKNTNAFKNNKVFVNVVDPLAEGGPAWSRINFLKVAVEKLSN